MGLARLSSCANAWRGVRAGRRSGAGRAEREVASTECGAYTVTKSVRRYVAHAVESLAC